jgi:hypothetical protein
MRGLHRSTGVLRKLPLVLAAAVAVTSAARADVFTYQDEDGQTVTAEARLAGAGDGAMALELPDGQIRLVPQGAIEKREVKTGPEPLDHAAVAKQLEEQFGEPLIRTSIEEPYVIGLVLTAPLEKSEEFRARSFLKKMGRFMKNVEDVFMDFARAMHFETAPPKYPLVVLVFETDTNFEMYADEITGGRGLSSGNIAGFYSGLTNWLAIRLSECDTFETPLHEAIHQQVYNRHVFQRLAPIPAWFNEGIATGFEGDGERIKVLPNRISAQYARRVSDARSVTWAEVVADDDAFRGDIFAGDAYAHAWSLHWLLCTQYKDEYTEYVRLLAQKETLEDVGPEQRTSEFQLTFGKSVAELQKEFPKELALGLKRQRISLADREPAGLSRTSSNLAEVELTAVSRGDLAGQLEVQGRLRNSSPLRAMSYHVTVETDAGTYADWHVPSLDMLKTAPLKKQYAQKLMRGARGGPSQTFRVRVRSVIPGSREAEQWKAGQLPVPEFGE